MSQSECNSLCPAQTWRACGYVRLSHEDGDKQESNSVTGQKALIRDYIARHTELVECGMKVDDGFSGSSFDRPAFQEMMAEVKAGKINCIVVKDLSRFGRNYLDAGEYIEKIFPFLGIRFIAINDNYDSLQDSRESDGLIIPFKNLINEAYCRDISVKIRSQLAVRRKGGAFTGSFAVYGYRKDADNKNHLLVDDFAADVVRDIFRWKLQGISAGDIAGRLNQDGILPPMDYKKSQGLRFATPFRVKASSSWSAAAILRILKNPVYTGTLEQGKTTTPSYKVKRRVVKPQEEWDIVEGAHEAIIDRQDFEIVQKVLARDTRTRPGNISVELFSGMVYCGECGAAMVRKTVPSGKCKYVYYVCAAHKNAKTCHSHALRDSILEKIVLESIKKQVQSILGTQKLQALKKAVMMHQAGVDRHQARFDKKQEEISRYQRLLTSLYENLTEQVIDMEEYIILKKNYTTLLAEAEGHAKALQARLYEEMQKAVKNGAATEQSEWLEALDRAAVVFFIERILVYQDRQVEIVYSWQDGYRLLAELS